MVPLWVSARGLSTQKLALRRDQGDGLSHEQIVGLGHVAEAFDGSLDLSRHSGTSGAHSNISMGWGGSVRPGSQ